MRASKTFLADASAKKSKLFSQNIFPLEPKFFSSKSLFQAFLVSKHTHIFIHVNKNFHKTDHKGLSGRRR